LSDSDIVRKVLPEVDVKKVCLQCGQVTFFWDIGASHQKGTEMRSVGRGPEALTLEKLHKSNLNDVSPGGLELLSTYEAIKNFDDFGVWSNGK
jgi:hypothetical protein